MYIYIKRERNIHILGKELLKKKFKTKECQKVLSLKQFKQFLSILFNLFSNVL